MFTFLRSMLRGAAALCLCGSLSGGLQAAPLVITPGQSVLFNVDMTGLTPTPVYTSVTFLSGFDIGNSVSGEQHISFFSDLQGQGSELADPFTGIGDLIAFALTDAGFTDGVFSVLISVVGGQLALDPQVVGQLLTPRGPLQTDALALVGELLPGGPGTGVPEPTGLALVALALACLALARPRPRS